MSFLINGLEMPKDGCHHMICVYADGTVSTGGRVYMATPVPSHGRLIDADALINALQELFDRRNKNAEYMGFRGASVNWNDAICYIKDAPIIIPASEEEI